MSTDPDEVTTRPPAAEDRRAALHQLMAEGRNFTKGRLRTFSAYEGDYCIAADEFNEWFRELEAALLVDGGGPQDCISCGEANDGGYMVEDGPGPFCSQCWQLLEQEFTKGANGDVSAPQEQVTLETPHLEELLARTIETQRPFKSEAEIHTWAKRCADSWIAAEAADPLDGKPLRADGEGRAHPEWQPIATAPIDTVVLVHDEGYVGKAMLTVAGWLDVECGRDDALFDVNPTDWMPLPDPPAVSGGAVPPQETK